jgi:hypothetical protein
MELFQRYTILDDLRSTVLNYFGTSGFPVIQLHKSTVLVDLRSIVQNYFGSLGVGPFQCIALIILWSVVSLK